MPLPGGSQSVRWPSRKTKRVFSRSSSFLTYRRPRAACANQSQGARRPIGRVGGPRAPCALAFATSHGGLWSCRIRYGSSCIPLRRRRQPDVAVLHAINVDGRLEQGRVGNGARDGRTGRRAAVAAELAARHARQRWHKYSARAGRNGYRVLVAVDGLDGTRAASEHRSRRNSFTCTPSHRSTSGRPARSRSWASSRTT